MSPNEMRALFEAKGFEFVDGDVLVMSHPDSSYLLFMDDLSDPMRVIAMQLDATQWRGLAQVAASTADLLKPR